MEGTCASPIPVGGGTDDAAGNAHALASRWPHANRDHDRPVTYDVSHIRAVAFEHTILTYSQPENPRSSWSADRIRLQQLSREVVSGD